MKAKTAITLVFLTVGALANRIEAQTNATPVTNAVPVITTNVWTRMPWYREVDGRVYDPQRSALWKELNGLAEIKKILPDAVVWQWCQDRQMFNDQGSLMSVSRIYGKKFVIRHYSLEIVQAGPSGWEPAGTEKVGNVVNLQGLKMMYVGTKNYSGEVLPVWDCGESVKSLTVTVVATNYPSHKSTFTNEQKMITSP